MDGWRILAIKEMDHQRCSMESWYIKAYGSQMNRDEGALPSEYNGLIRKIRRKSKGPEENNHGYAYFYPSK